MKAGDKVLFIHDGSLLLGEIEEVFSGVVKVSWSGESLPRIAREVIPVDAYVEGVFAAFAECINECNKRIKSDSTEAANEDH